MTPDQYNRLTFRQYLLMREGYNEEVSHRFEHTRAIVYTLSSIYRDPKKPMPTMEEFWPLPTDERQVKVKVDDLAEMARKMNEYYYKTYHKNVN